MAKKQEKDEEEFYLTRPTTTLDLEARYAAEEAEKDDKDDDDDDEDAGRDYAVEDNDTSNYVAVDSSYMTYADETHMPLRAEEGPEAEAEKRGLEGLATNSVLAATSGSAVKEKSIEPGTYADDARRTREGESDDERKAAAKEQKAAAKEEKAAAKEQESMTTKSPAPA